MARGEQDRLVQERFADRIVALRGVESQAAFALRVEMDRNYYRRLEKGGHSPNLATLLKLARAHGTTMSALIAGLDPPDVAPPGDAPAG